VTKEGTAGADHATRITRAERYWTVEEVLRELSKPFVCDELCPCSGWAPFQKERYHAFGAGYQAALRGLTEKADEPREFYDAAASAAFDALAVIARNCDSPDPNDEEPCCPAGATARAALPEGWSAKCGRTSSTTPEWKCDQPKGHEGPHYFLVAPRKAAKEKR
jgi:hypothetical protein